MFASRIRTRLPAMLVAAVTTAASAAPISVCAQPPARVARADPLDAQTAVPPAPYRSAFGDYRGFADEPVRSWREANDTVGRIGGWRVYAREASETDDANETDQASDRARGDERQAGPAGHEHGHGGAR